MVVFRLSYKEIPVIGTISQVKGDALIIRFHIARVFTQGGVADQVILKTAYSQ